MPSPTPAPAISTRRNLPLLAWAPLLAVVLVAFTWRLLGLWSTEAWRDEAITIIHTRSSWWQLLSTLHTVEDTPPLGFLLFKLWSGLTDVEVGFRLLSVLAGTTAVGVLALVGCHLDRRAGLAAGLLAAVSANLIHYSQEIRAYSLIMLCTSLCLLAAEHAARPGARRRWWILLAGAGTVAAHLHASGLFVLPMSLVYLVIRAPGWRGIWRPGLVAALAWANLSFPILAFSVHWSRMHAAEGVWWLSPPGLKDAEVLLQRFLGLHHIGAWSETGTWGLGMWGGFALERLLMLSPVALLVSAFAEHRLRRAAVALLCAACTFVLLMWITSLTALPNVVERTLLPATLPILLLLGLGVGAASRKASLVAASAVLILVAIWAGSWVWLVQAGPPRRPETRAAMEWLRPQLRPHDIVVTAAYGFEDLIVYHLWNDVAGEKFFSEGVPVYAGKPPRHLGRYRAHDPAWAERLSRALDEAQQRTPGYAVWLVRHGRPPAEPGPALPEGVLAEQHTIVERFILPAGLATSVVQYARSSDSTAAVTTEPASE